MAAGSDADIVIWDPEAKYTITAATQNMHTDYSIFEGFQVKGNARQVFSRGELVVDGGKFIGTVGRGRYLHREVPGAMSLYVEGPTSLTDAYGLRADPHLYNPDLAPTTPEQRTWGTYNYIALWFSMSMEVTTYMLASSLIAGGMNWKQAIATILLGNLIVLIPMLLNAHAGTEVRHSLPRLCARSVWRARRQRSGDAARVRGLRLVWHPVLDRRPVDYRMVNVLWPASAAMPWVLWMCFLGFWLLNMAVVWRGVESIRFLQSFSAPFLLDHVAGAARLHDCTRPAASAPC